MSAVPKEFHGKPEYEIKKWHEVKKGYTQFKDGDALFAKITPCFENGKACVIEQFPNGWELEVLNIMCSVQLANVSIQNYYLP